MKFIKVRVLPDNKEQIINLTMIKRIIPDGKTSEGENKYELKFEGTDIVLSEKEARKVFAAIGVGF